jgi:hypothetical protein
MGRARDINDALTSIFLVRRGLRRDGSRRSSSGLLLVAGVGLVGQGSPEVGAGFQVPVGLVLVGGVMKFASQSRRWARRSKPPGSLAISDSLRYTWPREDYRPESPG